jgi:hypothetical protein
MSLFTQTLYLSAKTKPQARVADDGVFVLTLLTYAPIHGRIRDAWRLLWAGPAAQAWWQQHGADLVPGAAVLVDVDLVRPFDASGRASGAEIHAAISAIVVTHVPGQRAAYAAAQCAIHCDFAAY